MTQSVLSIGNFDGLHIGHRKLLKELTAMSRDLKLPSVVITFDNHPAQVLERRLHPTAAAGCPKSEAAGRTGRYRNRAATF